MRLSELSNLGRRPQGLRWRTTKEDAVTKTGEGTSVAIIGAGIGGLYVAAELGMAGCKLRLHDINDKALAAISSRGDWARDSE